MKNRYYINKANKLTDKIRLSIVEYNKMIQGLSSELDRLEENNEYYRKGYAELYKRISKAIELIEEDYFEDGSANNIDDVLDILKGVNKDKEIEKLNKGYCPIKEKCNKGECDCTNEEYNQMCEENIKLDLEIERLSIELNQCMIERNDYLSRNEKAIEYIETHQLNFKKGTITFGSERLSIEERKLLDILKGVNKDKEIERLNKENN